MASVLKFHIFAWIQLVQKIHSKALSIFSCTVAEGELSNFIIGTMAFALARTLLPLCSLGPSTNVKSASNEASQTPRSASPSILTKGSNALACKIQKEDSTVQIPRCTGQHLITGAAKQEKRPRLFTGLLKVLKLLESCLSEMAALCFVKAVPKTSNCTSIGIISASATISWTTNSFNSILCYLSSVWGISSPISKTGRNDLKCSSI